MPRRSAEELSEGAETMEPREQEGCQDADDLSPDDFCVPEVKYEYLDHTADVQLHSWGETMEEAFEQCAIAMFNYMTELERVEVKQVHHVEAEGHDMQSLLFHFLDELLFMFCAEPYLVAKRVKITEFDRENFRIKARAAGEEFTIGKHTQGAEVKAITYSAMQIHDRPEVERPELFVIVDI